VSIGFRAIVGATEDHALTVGVFDRVGRHESANPPGNGLTASIWVDRVRPDRRMSGLAATSVVVVLNVRMVTSVQQEPADDIDVNLMDALDVLFAAYSGNFTLGGLIQSVDLLGRSGVDELRAEAGYFEQAGQVNRALLAFVPCVVNDVWVQSA
jgi:hypothetical protein